MLTCLLGAALALATSFAEAQGHESYDKAREAVRSGRWQEAIQFLTEAIHDNPQEQFRSSAEGTTDYFPYLYRGLAYFKAGERKKALADFGHSKRAGALHLAAADSQAATVLREEFPWLRALEQGRQQMLRAAPDSAEDSVLIISTDKDTAVTGISPTESAARAAGRKPPVRKPPGTASPIAHEPPADESLLQRGKGLYADGRYPEAKEVLSNFLALYPANPEARVYLDTITANALAIRRGIAAYLEGNYRFAIQELRDAAVRNHGTPRLYGYLATAYAAAYFLSGSKDSALRELAAESYRTARAIDATYVLDTNYVSPRIITLLNSR